MAPAEKDDTPKLMTESQLRRDSKKNYMKERQLAFFKHLLLENKQETQEHIDSVRHELLNVDHTIDILDRAALEDDRSLKLRIVDRELKLTRKIDEALSRIADSSYGWCAQTGEPIGVERLLLRPTATLCIDAKEFAEGKERHFANDDR